MLQQAVANTENNRQATIFGYYVNDPERYGVVEFDINNKVKSIRKA